MIYYTSYHPSYGDRFGQCKPTRDELARLWVAASRYIAEYGFQGRARIIMH